MPLFILFMFYAMAWHTQQQTRPDQYHPRHLKPALSRGFMTLRFQSGNAGLRSPTPTPPWIMIAALKDKLPQEDTSSSSAGESFPESPNSGRSSNSGEGTVPRYGQGKRDVRSTATPSTLNVDFCNIRGLHSNLNAVHHHLETARPALLFLTETQIARPSDTAYLQYPGYKIEHNVMPHAEA